MMKKLCGFMVLAVCCSVLAHAGETVQHHRMDEVIVTATLSDAALAWLRA